MGAADALLGNMLWQIRKQIKRGIIIVMLEHPCCAWDSPAQECSALPGQSLALSSHSEGLPAPGHHGHHKRWMHPESTAAGVFLSAGTPDWCPSSGGRLLPELLRMEVVEMIYLDSPPPCSQLHTAVWCRDTAPSSTHLSTASQVPGSSLSLETLNIITKFNAFIIARWISEQRS